MKITIPLKNSVGFSGLEKMTNLVGILKIAEKQKKQKCLRSAPALRVMLPCLGGRFRV